MERNNKILDDIFTEWRLLTKGGVPYVNEPYHLVLLERAMNNLNLPSWFDKKWLLSELRGNTYYTNILFGNIKDVPIITEASLAGRTVNYSQSTGAFYKYVEMAKDPKKDYTANKDTPLYDVNNHNKAGDIKKGSTFKILDKHEADLKKIGASYATKIKYKKLEYMIKLNAILKPSGKQVDFIQVDLKDKINTSVWEPFKGGHGHEGQITNVFINGSGGNWEFQHGGKEYHITRIGAPSYKGPGNPKTDLYVKLDNKIGSFGTELKISLKASNATWIENWMKPERMEQIFGKAKCKKHIKNMLKSLNDGDIGVRSPYMHWFVKDKGYNSVKMTKKETLEALSGAKKFGKSAEATANCFFKGGVPAQITTLIGQLSAMSSTSQKPGLHIRGYGQGGNSACYEQEKNGSWKITSIWSKYFSIK